MDKETFSMIFNVLFTILGFGGAFVINRLAKSIDGLVRADTDIMTLIVQHREDVIKNYATAVAVQQMKSEIRTLATDDKKDIIGRVDRLEMTFKEALMAHEHRETAMYSAQRAQGKDQS